MTRSIELLAIPFAILISSYAVAAEPVTAVASNGETRVAATAGKLTVQVMIKTHEVKIGKPGEARAIIEPTCTYSRYPCSIVDRVSISVNHNPLAVPRSAFCDLADLSNAEIMLDDSGSVLTLHGGDASASYIVKIEFDANLVKRRILSNASSPNRPLQETNYYYGGD
jgi:hypothetical protein